MGLSTQGGIRLFRIGGIQVSLHWAWVLAVMYFVNGSRNEYGAIGWAIADCLALFGIVLLHEFGHVLACRSVGGQADQIMLWPLGGVAFVNPPRRPGAYLWSIVAGPLVNVILLPLLIGVAILSGTASRYTNGLPLSDLQHFIISILTINVMLLVFNLLPIYPLDGGQILRGVLWYLVGEARSLLVASSIGLGAAGLGIVAILAFRSTDVWLIVIAAFAGIQSWAGLQRAKQARLLEVAARHSDAHCPACGTSPPVGDFWKCGCGQSFDVFTNRGTCPNCGATGSVIACSACGARTRLFDWFRAPTPPANRPTHVVDTTV